MLALEVKNLAVYVQASHKALIQNVSFNLELGKTIALMGPSGSGKSITSMAIANALNTNLYSKAEHFFMAGKRPALIMQNPADCFDPLFTIEHTLQMAQALSQYEMLNVLQEVGFEQGEHILKCYPFELSGGMLHKVMIAMAIVQVQSGQACCIIADEPIAGLDAISKLKNLTLIKQLQKKYNFALLYIDHDLGYAKLMGDELAVMHEGQIVEYGALKEVMENPKHFYTKALLQATQDINIKKNIPLNVQDNTTILSCANITKTYAKSLALNNISFKLQSGQNLGIVGHNGAGKSTLVRAILALEPLDHGNIEVFNQTIDPHARAWRKHIQAVFQHPRMAVNPRMRVHDILMEPLRAHGFKDKNQEAKEVETLLNIVQLPLFYAKAYPSQMSGGQLQRLCIARALALKPKILILDEPLTDLDSVVAEETLHMLEDIKQNLHISLLYISHHLPSVLRLCERILVLDNGNIVDDFLSSEYADPVRHEAFKKLL